MSGPEATLPARSRAPALDLLKAYGASSVELLRSLVSRRRLLFALAQRDVSDDYVHHAFSSHWAIVMPLFTVAVYVFAFTVVWPTRVTAPEGYATDAIVYLLSGILPWLALNMSTGRALTSIANNANIVKQMSFPLELLPVKTLVSPLVFFGVGLAAVILYAGWLTRGSILPFYLIGVPAVAAITLVLLLALAVGLSALQVFLRDTREFVSMFFSIGLFLHPILYLPSAIPEAVRGAVYASPFSYLIFCWQDVLFYGEFHRPWAWAVSAVFAAALYVLAARLFMASRPHFGEFL